MTMIEHLIAAREAAWEDENDAAAAAITVLIDRFTPPPEA